MFVFIMCVLYCSVASNLSIAQCTPVIDPKELQHLLLVVYGSAATIGVCTDIACHILCVFLKPCFIFWGDKHTADTFEAQRQDDNLRLDGRQASIVFANVCFCSLPEASMGKWRNKYTHKYSKTDKDVRA